ncbi:hypothetical protein BDZ89DRAFT_1055496 [Hymenopellis radicata]|nr:hypothetical protein BDZ89DRAFT_1055496 [Hymenopellis radicata]
MGYARMVIYGYHEITVESTSSVIYGKRSVYDWDLGPTVVLKVWDACMDGGVFTFMPFALSTASSSAVSNATTSLVATPKDHTPATRTQALSHRLREKNFHILRQLGLSHHHSLALQSPGHIHKQWTWTTRRSGPSLGQIDSTVQIFGQAPVVVAEGHVAYSRDRGDVRLGNSNEEQDMLNLYKALWRDGQKLPHYIESEMRARGVY